MASTSSSPKYVEIQGASGQVWRFAAGTRAGYAVKRIRSKVAQEIVCIAAVKEDEEPVEFGPDAELVSYGDNWRLKLVQEAQEEADSRQQTQEAQVSEAQLPQELLSSLFPGGKVPPKAELSREYIGRVVLAFALAMLLGAALTFCLQLLPAI